MTLLNPANCKDVTDARGWLRIGGRTIEKSKIEAPKSSSNGPFHLSISD